MCQNLHDVRLKFGRNITGGALVGTPVTEYVRKYWHNYNVIRPTASLVKYKCLCQDIAAWYVT